MDWVEGTTERVEVSGPTVATDMDDLGTQVVAGGDEHHNAAACGGPASGDE
ncbi:MAG: hypothetical protein ACT4NY_03220 [Pseudonocardiales bacterium]